MKKIDIRDFMNYHYPTGLIAAPDGKHGVFAVVDVNEKENCYDSCLWTMDLSDGSVRKLTSGRKERNFSWIDGETLLFAGCREKEYKDKIEDGETWTCFYTIGLHGGEAEFSFAVPYAVGKFAVCGNKVFMSVKYEYAKEEKDYEVFDELPFWANGKGVVNKKRNRLAVYDREKETMEIITPEYETVENFWLEEDCLLYTGVQYTDLKSWRPGLYRVGLEGYERETLIPQDRMRIDYACVLKGSVTLFGSEMKTYGVNENPQLFRLEDGTLKELAFFDRSIHNSICSDCKFADGEGIVHDDERIYFISTFRKQSVICSVDAEGNFETLYDRQGSVHTLSLGAGAVWYTAMRDMGLTEIYRLKDGKEEKLTAFNDGLLAERDVCPVEEFTFTYKDVELDGYVMKPAGFDPEKKYPALLTVHGGPRATFGPVFFHESQAFANAGYFVFFTNPVGSDGRGNAFADLSGRYGTVDFENCLAMTDEVLKRYPQIDEKRVGIMGGSYGGFMCNWAIGNTDRFAAAASQRSISNWISLSMTTDIGYSFDLQETAGDPWNSPDKMWVCSPLKYAHKAKTPTLFIQSDEDYRCYMGNALQMFSALKYFGVETRMCLFHGENHELSRSGKPSHRLRRLSEMMEWFEKYLK